MGRGQKRGAMGTGAVKSWQVRRLAWLAALLCATSCFTQAANKRYAAQVGVIDEHYEDGVRGVQTQYAAALDAIELLAADLVEVRTASHSAPVEAVEDRADLAALRAECDGIVGELSAARVHGADAPTFVRLLNACQARYRDAFLDALSETYWAADLDWIAEALRTAEERVDVESLFVYSHNLRLRAYIAHRVQELNAERLAALQTLRHAREQAYSAARERRDAEIKAERRRFAAAVAAAADGFVSPNRSSSAGPNTSPALGQGTAPSCSSDFSCGIGRRCVKPYYGGAGYCAKAVNEYGVQTFELPRTDSVLPNMPDGSDCRFNTDCPPSFQCDTGSGACLR